MPKIQNLYLEVDPFKIIEKGYHKNRHMVSESIFSLGNEYSGVRGYFEEGYSGKHLEGSYFNGIYEYALSETPNAYKGIIKRTHFTINSVNYLKCRISTNDEVLDLNISNIKDFYRELDMRSGLYTREFTWLTKNTNIYIKFERMLNMTYCHEATQRITFRTDKDTNIGLELSLDSNVLHWGSDCYFKKDSEFIGENYYGLSVKTLTTNQKVISVMGLDLAPSSYETKDMCVTVKYNLTLKKDEEKTITRYVINLVDKFNKYEYKYLINQAKEELSSLVNKGYHKSLEENKDYYAKLWDRSDIEIGGDIYAQQGIRYSIFQLEQTYHGYENDNNIGAKGLTGEAYSGHAFWDSETYCLPYYLFNNKEAAKSLLMFRYNTLKEAKERAKDLDCEGACYPIATRNGKEGCNLWQHASLQLQPSTGVFYAIYHYMNLYDDKEFLNNYGLEMVVEIAKFLLSRGQYNQDKSKFSYFCVMGPDEFQMMVNHNTYTNFMAKKVFDYLIDIIDNKEYDTKTLFNKCGFTENHIEKMRDASRKMIILYNPLNKLYEQNEGFFDLPHIDINSIKEEEFPLYSHWSYDRIYRNDMIKQPDVLMFMFLYSQDFSYNEKLANYEFYEPKTIHESSLSPSIHSIFACELNKHEDALKYFGFATRLDLDDYNRNTCEGIHMTSIAAAWMNIVYGFGGLRSDKKTLILNPMILDNFDYYSFKLSYKNSNIKVKVDKKNVSIINDGEPIQLNIYGKDIVIKDKLELKYENR